MNMLFSLLMRHTTFYFLIWWCDNSVFHIVLGNKNIQGLHKLAAQGDRSGIMQKMKV